MKVDSATPKKWLSKGVMINQHIGVAPSTFHVVHLFTTFLVAIAPRLELQGPCISIDVEGASSLVAVNYARCNCLK